MSGTEHFEVGFSNINAWLMTIAYGMCFGIELTMNNIGALFFHSYFGMSVTVAGAIASIWGATNLFARSIGGFVSDYMNKNYGVRGRLWAYWFVQTLEGTLCIILSLITLGLDAPHGQGEPSLTPWVHLIAFPFPGSIKCQATRRERNSGKHVFLYIETGSFACAFHGDPDVGV